MPTLSNRLTAASKWMHSGKMISWTHCTSTSSEVVNEEDRTMVELLLAFSFNVFILFHVHPTMELLCVSVCRYMMPIHVSGPSLREKENGRTKDMLRQKGITSGYIFSSSRLMVAISLSELSLASINSLCRRSGPSSISQSCMSGSIVVQPPVKSSCFCFEENLRICTASIRV